jgi:hypothetical protein
LSVDSDQFSVEQKPRLRRLTYRPLALILVWTLCGILQFLLGISVFLGRYSGDSLYVYLIWKWWDYIALNTCCATPFVAFAVLYWSFRRVFNARTRRLSLTRSQIGTFVFSGAIILGLTVISLSVLFLTQIAQDDIWHKIPTATLHHDGTLHYVVDRPSFRGEPGRLMWFECDGPGNLVCTFKCDASANWVLGLDGIDTLAVDSVTQQILLDGQPLTCRN